VKKLNNNLTVFDLLKTHFRLSLFCLSLFSFSPSSNVFGQTPTTSPNLCEIHGNFQVDMQYYNPDSSIGAPAVPQKTLMNGFLNLIYTRDKFTAGIRYEAYLGALQGFDPRYKGTGLLYRFATYATDELEITAGSFYEQFGNGLVLRTYEDRGLGYDNALEGLRVKVHPHRGIFLKGVYGLQRSFMTYGTGTVRGIDGEININELSDKFSSLKTNVILGGSFVSKYQADAGGGPYVLPQNVGAMAGRINVHRGKINFQGEYAYKINDPSTVNNFNYKPGEALFLSASYSKKGLGISLSGKRIDNMDFRSDRTATLNNLNINYLPALTRQHTYSMLNFYPYATQPNGEMGYQAEVVYKIKKGTLLGGEYGTSVLVNFASVSGLDTVNLKPKEDSARMGYKSKSFLGFGQKYFDDFNIEIDRKISQHFKVIAIYASQTYNKAVVQGKPGTPIIYSQIGVADLIYRVNDSLTFRVELENLYTKQDHGSWGSALLEVTFAPHYFVAASDQWNYGNTIPVDRIHYYNFTLGYIRKTNRYQISYGKQRAGIYCVGGVCRTVPASNGLTFTMISNF
jgi:hypothetical protein